jgi:serine/threonine protein kinase
MSLQLYLGASMDDNVEGDEDRTRVVDQPTEPEIHEDVWSLIRRCLEEDPKNRPTMDEIVKEMESWSFF